MTPRRKGRRNQSLFCDRVIFYDDKEMLWKLIMDIWQFQRVKGSLLPILLLLEAMLGKCESVLTERSRLGNRF